MKDYLICFAKTRLLLEHCAAPGGFKDRVPPAAPRGPVVTIRVIRRFLTGSVPAVNHVSVSE